MIFLIVIVIISDRSKTCLISSPINSVPNSISKNVTKSSNSYHLVCFQNNSNLLIIFVLIDSQT